MLNYKIKIQTPVANDLSLLVITVRKSTVINQNHILNLSLRFLRPLISYNQFTSPVANLASDSLDVSENVFGKKQFNSIYIPFIIISLIVKINKKNRL